MIILFLAANQPVPAYFARHSGLKDGRMVPFSFEMDMSDCEVFILFSPFYVNGHYVSPDSVWKKYWSQYNPDIKFLTAGFANPPSQNYLEISDLPSDLTQFIANARPAGADDWQAADTGGLDMESTLARFFTGHGNESIVEQFNRLLRVARNIELDLKAGTPSVEIYELHLLDGDMAGRWRVFLNRWYRYSPFFTCLPFYPKFQEIETMIQKINPYFQSGGGDINLYVKTGCTAGIETIKNVLDEIAPHVEGIG